MLRNIFIFALVIGMLLLLGSCKKENNPVVPIKHPPDEIILEYPRNHQLDLPLLQMYVQWSCIDPDNDTLTYDVYFGKSDNPPLVSHAQNTVRYFPETLEYFTIYFWRVVAFADQDSSVSPIRDFRTERIPNQPPYLPEPVSPENGSIDLSINTDLLWSGSDPENDFLRYDVYFGDSFPPPLVSSRQALNSYELDTLDFVTTYFWKIDVHDDEDHTTEGPVWNFTTLEKTQGTDPGELREFILGNSGIIIEMVWIPAGSFMMGALVDEIDAISDEYPRHWVNINYDFWMSRYELTQQQWQAIYGTNPSFFQDDNRPVEQVSWDDVHQFLDTLNSQTESAPFRLPSEAEWEYACRSGEDNTRFHWGYDTTYQALYRYAWFDNVSDGQSHEIGLKRPNNWGLYDMHGNVWEWCEDWYHSTYDGAPIDGSAWTTIGNRNTRVRRGGGWNYGRSECRSAYRFRTSPSSRFSSQGLRLVKDAG